MYSEIKKIECCDHPEIFFAFGNEQFEKAKEKMPEGKQLYSCGCGMYVTQDGFAHFEKRCNEKNELIRKECTAQEIYSYEFDNHECGYTGDDSEALAIARKYFPNAKIRRRKGK